MIPVGFPSIRESIAIFAFPAAIAGCKKNALPVVDYIISYASRTPADRVFPFCITQKQFNDSLRVKYNVPAATQKRLQPRCHHYFNSVSGSQHTSRRAPAYRQARHHSPFLSVSFLLLSVLHQVIRRNDRRCIMYRECKGR